MLRIKVSQIGLEASHFTVEISAKKWEIDLHVYKHEKLEKLFSIISTDKVGKDMCGSEVYEISADKKLTVITEVSRLLQ